MENIQVYYYTRTGRSEKVANSIAQKYSTTAHKITDAKDYSGALGFIKGGANAAKKNTANISFEPLKKDVCTVIVFPIWAGTFPPAINTFLQNVKRENVIMIPTSLTTKFKDTEGFKQVVNLIGKDIYDIEINLKV